MKFSLLVRIHGCQDSEKYVEVMETTMLPFADEHLPVVWIYQQNNAPCHASEVAKIWFDKNVVRFMRCTAKLPDLNRIKNL